MKLRRIVPLDIENKILIPFACISLATVLCFCIILYFTEFQVKVEAERQEAQTLIGYLQADLQLEEYRREPERLLDKYREDYRSDCLFIYGPAGQLLMGDPEADVDAMELLAQISDPALGWQVRCYLDRGELGSTFIEEHDINVKASTACKFLKEGDKIKVSLRFRGRERSRARRGSQGSSREEGAVFCRIAQRERKARFSRR